MYTIIIQVEETKKVIRVKIITWVLTLNLQTPVSVTAGARLSENNQIVVIG